jgi:ATP-dependent DNA helicase DinG
MIDATRNLGDAVRALAGRCDWAATQDGVGFNGVDADFGHKMAEVPFERWSERQYAAVHRMLAKYAKQLRGYGIDYAALPAEKPADRGPLMVARVAGVCILCGRPIAVGSDFRWGMQRGTREHDACMTPAAAVAAILEDRAVETPAGTMLTVEGRAAEIATRADVPTHAVRIRTDEPEWEEDEDGPRMPTATDGILGPGGVIARRLPGYESRPQQLRMANLVEAAIAAGRHAVIEAGTGTGKSLGYLVPAILSGRRTIVSTADKGLQMQIARKDLPFLQATMPKPFVAVVLKGIGNYACKKRVEAIKESLEETLEGFEDEATFESPQAAAAWPALLEWVEETESGDVEDVPFSLPADLRERVTTDSDGCSGKKCPLHDACFAMRARAAARLADVVVVNHSLLFRDLAVRHDSDGYATVLPDADVIVIDEAHHLEDEATDAFGVEVDPSTWRHVERALDKLTVDHPSVRKASEDSEEYATAEQWAEEAKPVGSAIYELLGAYRQRLKEADAEVVEIGDDRPLARPAREALQALRERMESAAPFWLSVADREEWRKLGDRMEKLSGEILSVVAPDPDMVRYAQAETTKRGATVVTLAAKPIEVAPELRKRLFDPPLREHGDEDATAKPWRPAVICTSATITTGDGFAYWRTRVGLDDALELEVGSPFDYRLHALLYLPPDPESFDPRSRDQETTLRYQDRLAEELNRLLLVSEGGAFCLFTSARVMREMHRRLAPRLRGLVLLQGQDGLSRPEIVKRFKADGNAVLFGTKSFWEGVDVQGSALRLVVIDKLPFVPPDDPIFAARRRRINRRAGREWAAFMELDVPHATIALKQAFGRLIRTQDDRGCVALLDGRLSTKGYGSTILGALPPATRTSSLDAVKAHFGN